MFFNLHPKRTKEEINRTIEYVLHNFGRSVPPVIDTQSFLKSKIEMIESLADIKIATNLLSGGNSSDIHPIDEHYLKLQAEIRPLNRQDSVFGIIEKYVLNLESCSPNSQSIQTWHH